MPKYFVRVKFNAEGVRQVLTRNKGSGLRAAASTLIEAAGGKIEAYYFAFGEDDVIGIVDLPDNAAAASVSVAANSAGFVRFTLTPLVTVEEMDRAVEQSADLPVPGKE